MYNIHTTSYQVQTKKTFEVFISTKERTLRDSTQMEFEVVALYL